MAKLKLRNAVFSDAEQIFRWRNDPWIVSLGSSQKTVKWEEHNKWFERTIADENIEIFIVEINGQQAGQIRFSCENKKCCVVTIYLMKPYIGQGFGVESLNIGIQIISKKWALKYIYAYIQNTNTRSISAFKECGFKIDHKKTKVPKNHQCFVFEVE